MGVSNLYSKYALEAPELCFCFPIIVDQGGRVSSPASSYELILHLRLAMSGISIDSEGHRRRGPDERDRPRMNLPKPVRLLLKRGIKIKQGFGFSNNMVFGGIMYGLCSF